MTGMKALSSGYFSEVSRKEELCELLEAVTAELSEVKPNLVVYCGGFLLWYFFGAEGDTAERTPFFNLQWTGGFQVFSRRLLGRVGTYSCSFVLICTELWKMSI